MRRRSVKDHTLGPINGNDENGMLPKDHTLGSVKGSEENVTKRSCNGSNSRE